MSFAPPLQTTQPLPNQSMGDPTGSAQTPAAQDYRKRMMLAQSLMGQHANPNASFGGLANAGSSLAGAYMAQNAQNRFQQAQQPQPTIPAPPPAMPAPQQQMPAQPNMQFPIQSQPQVPNMQFQPNQQQNMNRPPAGFGGFQGGFSGGVGNYPSGQNTPQGQYPLGGVGRARMFGFGGG